MHLSTTTQFSGLGSPRHDPRFDVGRDRALVLTSAMRMAWAWTTLLMGCGGPSPDATQPLSKIASQAKLTLSTSPGSRRFASLEPVGGADPQVCFAVKSSARARLNGVILTVTDVGGWKGLKSGEHYCTYPLFEVPSSLKPSGTSSIDELSISDDTATLTMIVRDFTALHPVTVAEPSDGKVRSNGTLSLAAAPGLEATTRLLLELYSDHPSRTYPNGDPLPELHVEDQKGPGGSGNTATFSGGNVSLILQSGLPLPLGAAKLQGSIGLELQIDQCSGPAACVAVFDAQFSNLPIEVIN